ncbi:malonate decarboxylase holo-ACP synthase [Neisseria leonii]|uniref:malonate decarboxylase holo-ACP synthase n=1 Tax=Neisseria leonii TaxID=2995413 RepID=UPI00237ABB76|nr:malonate decarboxylase holo-ACP synthase [Neisseria sp. 3986]MDD9326519.1 malonate decarboxylase holo-ACP synthase [Neisseria sp. 3986]
MVGLLRPHDLLWGMRPEMLMPDAPDWAVAVLSAQWPVVVRRARVGKGQVAVGIRGRRRSERYAAQMPHSAICRIVRPEDLAASVPEDFPEHTQRLLAVGRLMRRWPWVWGYGGSIGFELACGEKVSRADSDTDLIVRTPVYVGRGPARRFLAELAGLPHRADVQFQTACGAFALREWAGGGAVMLKTAAGVLLTDNPWAVLPADAVSD